jgi:hypothetical protein
MQRFGPSSRLANDRPRKRTNGFQVHLWFMVRRRSYLHCRVLGTGSPYKIIPRISRGCSTVIRRARDAGFRLAKELLHPLVPPLILPMDTVRIDAVQDLDTVTGPLGHLGSSSETASDGRSMP